MVTKIVALVFVLLTTTSGWAGNQTARDNNSMFCPVTMSWIAIGDRTASIDQHNSVLSAPGQTVHEGKTTALDQNIKN